jgi:hypothetical protein
MTTFQAIKGGFVRDDGLIIPNDPNNADHVAMIASGITPAPIVTPPPTTVFTFAQFLVLLQAPELVLIMTSTDPQVRAWLLRMTATNHIDMTDPQIQAALTYAVSINLLTVARAAAIQASTQVVASP